MRGRGADGVPRRLVVRQAGKGVERLAHMRPNFVTRTVARLEGFEPPTNGFGSHYSIQLSYRRVFKGLLPSGAALLNSSLRDAWSLGISL